jgi:hypothetical protein
LSAQLAPRLNTLEVGIPFIMRFLAENPLPVARPAPPIEVLVPVPLAQSETLGKAPTP